MAIDAIDDRFDAAHDRIDNMFDAVNARVTRLEDMVKKLTEIVAIKTKGRLPRAIERDEAIEDGDTLRQWVTDYYKIKETRDDD